MSNIWPVGQISRAYIQPISNWPLPLPSLELLPPWHCSSLFPSSLSSRLTREHGKEQENPAAVKRTEWNGTQVSCLVPLVEHFFGREGRRQNIDVPQAALRTAKFYFRQKLSWVPGWEEGRVLLRTIYTEISMLFSSSLSLSLNCSVLDYSQFAIFFHGKKQESSST